MTKSTSSFYKRSGFAWSIPETLRLQREYELLELSIDEISRIHQRSPYAIAIRLIDEDFASQEQSDIRQYLAFTDYNLLSQENNISLCISDDDCQDNDTSSYISSTDDDSDNESDILTLKSQVSDLNSKLDNILDMLRRSNGGSVIGMY